MARSGARTRYRGSVYHIVSSLLSKSDFTNRIGRRCFKADGSEPSGILPCSISSSSRELKYTLSLLHFHSKKMDLILQEIYAKLTMYNFSRMITNLLQSEVKPGRKHSRQVNHTYAVKICRECFREKVSPFDLKALILRNTLPIRPDRHYERKPKKSSQELSTTE